MKFHATFSQDLSLISTTSLFILHSSLLTTIHSLPKWLFNKWPWSSICFSIDRTIDYLTFTLQRRKGKEHEDESLLGSRQPEG